MPDIAKTTANNNYTKKAPSTDNESTTTPSTHAQSPPPSGVKVHQIASMFSSLQQSTQHQQQRRSTIASLTNVVVVDNNETIFRPDSLTAKPVSNVADDETRHRSTSSGVKKRFMPARSRSTDGRFNVSSTTAAEDLHFLDHREKFSSAKALFENLERASRDQKRSLNGGRQSEQNFNHKSNSSASKRGSSTSPQRRPPPPPLMNTSIISSSSTVVTVIETRTEPFKKISNEKSPSTVTTPRSSTVQKNILQSPHARSPPPPIPPKPKSLCSPNVADQARHKFVFAADESSTKKDSPIDDGSLDRAKKELDELMDSLEHMTIFPPSTTTTANNDTTSPSPLKLNGVEKENHSVDLNNGARQNVNGVFDEADRSTPNLRHNQMINGQKTSTKINQQSELISSTLVTSVKQPAQSSSSAYEPYWRQPNYHHTKRQILASTNSESTTNSDILSSSLPSPSSKIVVEVSSTATTPTTKSIVEEDVESIKKSTSAHLTSMRDDDSKDSGIGSDSACSANFLEFGGGIGTKTSTDDVTASVVPESATATTTATNGSVEYMTPEEKKALLSPATQAILRRPPSSQSKSSASDEGEIKSLPSHLAIPHDVNSKRLSMCSVTSETNEHTILSSERYSMVDEMDVHWLSDDQFYVEIDGLGDDEIVDETPSSSVVVDYKKPTVVRFNTKRMKVYSTYSGVEYDRRNEDIDPVAASAEYELERRLEKMDIFAIDLDKGMDGLGFSIIGMGVGADAGLEKLGIFVKSITPGGAVFRDGRICVCDQIVEVDGKSLVGVSQTYAANVLRSTSGHVNFKIGRERDLDSSEIAQLIRQSLDQDQASNAREQAILCERLNMSPSLNNNGQSPASSSLPPPKPPAWGPSRNTPLPSSDSVFEDDDKTPDDNPRLQELMSQLKKPEPKDAVVANDETASNMQSPNATVASPSAPPIENPAFHVEPTSPIETEELQSYTHVTDEINKILYADDTTDVEDKMADALHIKENSGTYVVRRHLAADAKSNSTDSLDDDEHGLVLRIGNLESTLNEVKYEAEKYQKLLTDSQEHYDELDQRYKTAKKKIKDYQERERDLLEREEIHLQQLREKDAQYAALVKQLNDKVIELEKQLTDAQRKRASLAESASLSSMGAAMNGSTTATDMSSPAMAYLPAKKPTRSVHLTPDDQKPSTSGLMNATAEHRTTIEVGSETEVTYVDGIRHDFGVPYTQLLDSTAAKSKADAVRQSVIMSARSLPSRHADAEVYVTCHHTIEHAEILKTQPSHLMTESSSGLLHSSASTQNKNSPSKSSSTSASTSSGSPLSSRRILDLINFRKKAASNVNKDLEQAIRGGGDFERVPEVLQWTCDDVFKFLHSLGLNKYEPEFKINRIDGCKLLQLDGSKLKSMGVANHNDRAIIKKRVKDMKMQIEKERKKENRKLLQKFDKDRKTSKC